MKKTTTMADQMKLERLILSRRTEHTSITTSWSSLISWTVCDRWRVFTGFELFFLFWFYHLWEMFCWQGTWEIWWFFSLYTGSSRHKGLWSSNCRRVLHGDSPHRRSWPYSISAAQSCPSMSPILFIKSLTHTVQSYTRFDLGVNSRLFCSVQSFKWINPV